MPMEQRSPELENYQAMINHLALSFNSSVGADIDEMTSIGRYVFTKAKEAWDPERAAFSTLLYRMLTNAFCAHVAKNPLTGDHEKAISFLPSRHPEWHPRLALYSKESVSYMSVDARYVMWCLLNIPYEVFGVSGIETPKAVRGAIRKTMRKWGWTWKKIWRVNDEIKSAARRRL